MAKIEDTYLYRSTDVAMYLVAKAGEKKVAVNITKVQKLLYLLYGTFLCIYGERLLDEHPQAWPYGPVFPTTRTRLLKGFENFTEITIEDIPEEKRKELISDHKLNRVLDSVLSNFGSWNAGQLTEWSHSDGSPWDKAQKSIGFRWGDVISDQSIYDYFKTIIQVSRKDS